MDTSVRGTVLPIIIDDWGIENFEKTIICFCKDEVEMNNMEVYIISENFRNEVKTYNIWSPDYMRQCRSERMKRLYADPVWVAKWKKTLKVTGVGDRRKNNGRFSEKKPDREWYLVENMQTMVKNYGFPQRNKNGYVVWFEKFGYKSETIEVPYKTPGSKKMRKYLVVYKSDGGLEEAKATIPSLIRSSR